MIHIYRPLVGEEEKQAMLAVLAHGIEPSDELITSPFNFVASANAIRHVGARPVFANIEYGTFNLDLE